MFQNWSCVHIQHCFCVFYVVSFFFCFFDSLHCFHSCARDISVFLLWAATHDCCVLDRRAWGDDCLGLQLNLHAHLQKWRWWGRRNFESAARRCTASWSEAARQTGSYNMVTEAAKSCSSLGESCKMNTEPRRTKIIIIWSCGTVSHNLSSKEPFQISREKMNTGMFTASLSRKN